MEKFTWKAWLYILAVIVLGGLCLAVNERGLFLQPGQGPGLVALALLAIIITRLPVQSRTGQIHFNANTLVYVFAYLLLGLPAVLLIIAVSFLYEGLWRKHKWYTFLFNIATHVIMFQIADLLLRWIEPAPRPADWVTVLGLLATLAIVNATNHLLVAVVVSLTKGIKIVESGMFSPLLFGVEYTILCIGVSAAWLWRITPYAVVFALVPLYMFYVSMQIPTLEHLSETDHKTALYNSRFFAAAMKREFEKACRANAPLTVVMGDLDHFRDLNNTYGHLAGDLILKKTADILKQGTRNSDIVARFGGEEFVILMAETQSDNVYSRIEVLRQTIEACDFVVADRPHPIRVTISFGIASRDGAEKSPEELIKKADVALYHAKNHGRNQSCIYHGVGSAGGGVGPCTA